jgi:hypothetical protein
VHPVEILYSKERFVDLAPELPEIFYKHWQEIALNKDTIPLDPAWSEYMRLEALGVLHIVTARDGGRLVGYIFSLVTPHLHYKKSLTAYTDLMYFRREYTRGMATFSRYRDLLLFSEKMLRDMGVQKRYLMTKVYHDLTPLFERLGYKLIEKICVKML